MNEVYKKIWAPEHGEGEPMPIIYRMRGLLGDATEDMVNSLESNSGTVLHQCQIFMYTCAFYLCMCITNLATCNTAILHSHVEITIITEEDVDKEEVYKMASVLAEGDGLKVMLTRYMYIMFKWWFIEIFYTNRNYICYYCVVLILCSILRLATIKDLVLGRQLMTVLLKLFGFVVNVKACRQELIKTEMNTVNVMLGALNLALWAEQESGTSTKGQTITEQILHIMEVILLEASSQDPEIYTVRN